MPIYRVLCRSVVIENRRVDAPTEAEARSMAENGWQDDTEHLETESTTVLDVEQED